MDFFLSVSASIIELLGDDCKEPEENKRSNNLRPSANIYKLNIASR
jgi:hypothetical protein